MGIYYNNASANNGWKRSTELAAGHLGQFGYAEQVTLCALGAMTGVCSNQPFASFPLGEAGIGVKSQASSAGIGPAGAGWNR